MKNNKIQIQLIVHKSALLITNKQYTKWIIVKTRKKKKNHSMTTLLWLLIKYP